jgi:hypothetical protein
MSKRTWSSLLFLLALGGVVAAVAAAASPPAPPGLAQAIAAQERHTDALLARDGVVGTAATVRDGIGAVVVLTARAGVTGIPDSLDGVDVVVSVTGRISAILPKAPGGGGKVDPKSRFPRPVPIGVSTGNEGECSAGTIGARVVSGSNVYALSNNHVYARENAAPIGSRVLQPGRYDTGCAIDPADVIGTLAAFVPISFSGNNTVDAAIASTTTANVGNSTPSNGYGTPTSATTGAAVNMAVQKYGRTSSLTRGTITMVNATVDVGYGAGVARFVNQIVVQSNKPFIKPGDSGSLLVTNPGRSPVGLLFAGNQNGSFAVANRIQDVLSAFGVTVDGS